MYKICIVCLFLVPSVSLAWNVPQPVVNHIQQVVINAANKYGVDKDVMFVIIEQESGYDHMAVGDYGTSIGLVQIHLPAHPNISIDEAQNVYFSINYLAQQLAKGLCSEWSTCPLAKVDS